MRIYSKDEQTNLIFDLVQTKFEIISQAALTIHTYGFAEDGIWIQFEVYNDPNWEMKSVTVLNSELQIFLYFKTFVNQK